jgi:hypothetical protein
MSDTNFVPGSVITSVWLNDANGATYKGLATLPASLSGTVARTMKDKFSEAVSVLDFGADKTGVVDQSTLFNATTASINANASGIINPYFNYSVKLDVPFGTYKLNSDWVTPQRVDGSGIFTGAGRIVTSYSFCDLRNIISTAGLYITGGNNQRIDTTSGPITIDGGSRFGGVEWLNLNRPINGNISIKMGNGFANQNIIQNMHGGSIVIDDYTSANYPTGTVALTLGATTGTGVTVTAASVFFADLNARYQDVIVAGSGVATIKTVAVDGLSATVDISSAFASTSLAAGAYKISAFYPCHANLFLNCDVSGSSGLINSSVKASATNYAIGTYYEGGANIQGDFHLFGFQGDSLTTPLVQPDNWILGSVGVAERNRRDFLPFSGENLFPSGEWNYYAYDGISALYYPPYIIPYGARTPTIISDSTEPTGVGKGLQVTFTYGGGVGGGGIAFTIPPMPSGNAALTLYWKGDTPTSVTMDRGGGDITSYAMTGVPVNGTSWYLTRFSLKVSKTASTQLSIDYAIANGGPAQTIVVGPAVLTQEKAARLPAKPQNLKGLIPSANGQTLQLLDRYEQSNSITVASTNAVANVIDIPITFNTAFSVAPTAGAGSITYSLESTDAASDTNILHMKNHFIKRNSVTTSGFTLRVYTTGATDAWQGVVHWRAIGAK